MPLTTRCQHCGRLFPVYATQLKANRARVPCPQCGKRFDAVAGLIDEHIPAIDDPNRRRHPAHRTTVTPLTTATPAQSQVQDGPQRRRRGILWLGFGALTAILLTLALLAQVAWWGRGDWLRHPQVHALLEEVCPTLGIDVPLPRLPGTIEILESALIADPTRSDALNLHLAMVSRAEVPQRLPILQLELYDPAGSLLAARRFDAAEYLADPATPIDDGLPPQQAIHATLNIALPEAQPAGFRIRLL
jgi:predicted Zn finger-like uncharacterized protein